MSVLFSAILATGCAKTQDADEEVSEENSATETSETVEATLDGKVFVVEFYVDGTTDKSLDTLSFADGTFHSVYCDQYGYSAADYSAEAQGESIDFASTALSDDEGEMAWSGKVTGDRIEGDITWTKEGQDAILYHYSGTLQ